MPSCCIFPVERAKGDNLYSHYIFTKASVFVSLTERKPPLTQSVLFSQEKEKNKRGNYWVIAESHTPVLLTAET